MKRAKRMDWGEVPDATIKAFRLAVARLQREMVPLDFTGDSAVEVIIIDRRTHETMHYEPVRYGHDELSGEEEIDRRRALFLNLALAAGAVDTWHRIDEVRARAAAKDGRR